MEHLATFGLTRDPFSSDLQLDAAFAHSGFDEASRRLTRAVSQQKGLAVLTGIGGVGKTLLIRQLLESLEEEVYEACLLVPVPGVTDTAWLLSRFARQLGVEEPAEEPSGMLGQIYEQMAIVREDGRHCVLLLDEAQVLAQQGLLSVLRGLLNLEYEERRLLTVILAGLPAIADAIANEPALADRIDVQVRLAPLSAADVPKYLAHRIRAVEGTPAILESAAMSAIQKWGTGVPRRLNTLADNALFEAHLAGRMSATAEDVERAVKELGILTETGAAAKPAPAPDGLFAGEGAPELELSEVVAADTDPMLPRAGATVAILGDEAPSRSEAGSTVLLDGAAGAGDDSLTFVEDEPLADPGATAQRVALVDPNESTDGELDNLFAELVDE